MRYDHYMGSLGFKGLRKAGWAGHVTLTGDNTKYFERLFKKSHSIISKMTLIRVGICIYVGIGVGNMKPDADPSGRVV